MINAYLYLDDKKYRLLNLYFNFNQSLGTNNKPRGLPRGGQLNITIPANDKDLTMLDWTIHNNQQKKGRIEIMSRDGGSIGFKMEFANAFATSASYIYDSNSSEPMNYTITITAGILRINGDNSTIHKQTWDNGTAFNEQTPVTTNEEEISAFDEQIKVIDDNGKPIIDLAYCIECENHIIHSGRTDKNGLTQRLKEKEYRDDCSFYWGDEALTKIDNI